MPNDALASDLRRDGREASADAAEHLADDKLECRAVEVTGAHHEPRAEHVDHDARDADPAVALRVFRARAGDDGRDRGGEDVGLAVGSRSAPEETEH